MNQCFTKMLLGDLRPNEKMKYKSKLLKDVDTEKLLVWTIILVLLIGGGKYLYDHPRSLLGLVLMLGGAIALYRKPQLALNVLTPEIRKLLGSDEPEHVIEGYFRGMAVFTMLLALVLYFR